MNTHSSFTPAIVRSLMEIEAARETVRLTVLPPQIVERLRQEARVCSTHYSTRIEGNRLTLVEAEQAVLAGRRFPGRERDVREVQNYYRALQRVEEWAEQQVPITEELIRRLHALVFRGPRSKPTPYRDGQNVVRDTVSGELIYMPPEAGDVPGLVADLVAWITRAEQEGLPVPVIAGLAHYQFVTIHPFYDGNGRTARALATLILYRHGYDLGRFHSLEEFYAQDLPAYYAALRTHPHHNYYMGRAEAGLTEWLTYFLSSMAAVLRGVVEKVQGQAEVSAPVTSPQPRRRNRRARADGQQPDKDYRSEAQAAPPAPNGAAAVVHPRSAAGEARQYIVIENEREVDAVPSPEDAERRARYGWHVAFDCAGDEWRTVLEKAHRYAREHRKKCRLPAPLSDEEMSRVWTQVYTLLLGERLYHLLIQLYAHDPDKAIEIGMDAIRRRLGASSEKTEEPQPNPVPVKKPRRKKQGI